MVRFEAAPDQPGLDRRHVIEMIKGLADAPEIRWAIAGDVLGGAGPVVPGLPAFGLLLAFEDEDGYQRWSARESQRPDPALAGLVRREATPEDLLVSVAPESRERLEAIAFELIESLDRGSNPANVRPLS
jgi:hypothetical protein